MKLACPSVVLHSRGSPFAVLIAAGLFAGGSAHAQLLQRYLPSSVPAYQLDPALAVLENGGPDYRSTGTRLGDIVVRPSIDETFGYNDNPLGLQNARSSAEIESSASLSANSDWSRNSIGASVSIDDQRYLNLSIANETNSTAFVGGSLDIGRDTLSFGAGHVSGNLGPTDVLSDGFGAPVPYQSNDVRVAYTALFNRLSVAPELDLTSYRFGRSAAGTFITDDTGLDKNQIEGGLTATYDFSAGHKLVFVWNETSAFFQHRAAGQPNPNYLDTLAAVGFDYDTHAFFRYDLLLGYEERHFSSGSISALNEPVVEASVTWTPTRLTTLSAAVVRHLSDASYNVATNLAYTEGKLIIDHEYRRDVILNGTLDIESSDAGAGSFSRQQYSGSVGATWLLNRYARLSSSYTYTHGTGGSASLSIVGSQTAQTNNNFGATSLEGSSYDGNVIQVSLHLAL